MTEDKLFDLQDELLVCHYEEFSHERVYSEAFDDGTVCSETQVSLVGHGAHVYLKSEYRPNGEITHQLADLEGCEWVGSWDNGEYVPPPKILLSERQSVRA